MALFSLGPGAQECIKPHVVDSLRIYPAHLQMFPDVLQGPFVPVGKSYGMSELVSCFLEARWPGPILHSL